MSNLIVTIISIVLIAIAAIMGLYYGGIAFAQGQINSDATAIITSAQQILDASRVWAVNHNQPDVSAMPNVHYDSSGFGIGVDVSAGSGLGALVTDHELSSWPPMMGSDAPAAPAIGGTGSITASTPTAGVYDFGTWSFGGYQGVTYRMIFAYKGGNYVAYMFYKTDGTTSFTAADINTHPIIQIAKSINNTLRQTPSNANMTTVATLGVPSPPTTHWLDGCFSTWLDRFAIRSR